jgi:ABC-type tungstate transport system permease subunit
MTPNDGLVQIDWIVGDTTDSINYIASGDADIAITYNAAAEYRALNLSFALKRVYGFRDHFYLVGPE